MTPEDITAVLADQLKVCQSHVQVIPPNRLDAGQSSGCDSETDISVASFSQFKGNHSGPGENNSETPLASVLQALLKYVDLRNLGLACEKKNEQAVGLQSPQPGSTASSVSVAKLLQLEERKHLQALSDSGNSPASISDASESFASASMCESSSDLTPTPRQAPRKTKQMKSMKQNITGKPNKSSKRSLAKGEEPSHDELKRHKNRMYARKSREKKSNETKKLRERSLEQEAIIEIYKKTLTILHTRLAGNSPTWSMRHIEWYPSQAPRLTPPITVKCYFPDYDEKFFCELGNNAYGQLYKSTEVKPAVAAIENQPEVKPFDSAMVAEPSKHDSLSSHSQIINPATHPLCTHNLLPFQTKPILIDDAQLVRPQNPGGVEPPCSSPAVRQEQSQIPKQRFSPYNRPEHAPVHQLKEEELPADLRKLLSEVHQKQGKESSGVLNVIYISALPNHLKKTSLNLPPESTNAKQNNLNDIKQMVGDAKNPTQIINNVKKEQMSNVSSGHDVLGALNHPVSQYQMTQSHFTSPWMTNEEEQAPATSTSSSQTHENRATLAHVECSTSVSQMSKRSNAANLHDMEKLNEGKLMFLKMMTGKGDAPMTQSSASAAEQRPQQSDTDFTQSIVSSNGMPASSNIPNVSMLFDAGYTSTPKGLLKPPSKMNECKTVYTNATAPSYQFKGKGPESVSQPHITHSVCSGTTFNEVSSVAQQQPNLLNTSTNGTVNTVGILPNPVVNNPKIGNMAATLQMHSVLNTPSTNFLTDTSCLGQGVVSITPTRYQFTSNTDGSESGVTASKISPMSENEIFVVSERPIETGHAQERLTNPSNDSSLNGPNKSCGLGSLGSFVLENVHVELEHLKPTLPD